MSRRPVPRGLILSIAFFGVFVGHAITYIVLAGNAAVRSSMLQATGHGYLPAVTHAGLALAIVGLAGVFLAGLGGAAVAPSPARLAGRVSTFQIPTFAAIEIAERIAVHAPLHDLTHVLPVGAVVQLGVAMAVVAVIRLILRAADDVSHALAAAAAIPPATVVAVAPFTAIPLRRRERSAARGRAPPR